MRHTVKLFVLMLLTALLLCGCNGKPSSQDKGITTEPENGSSEQSVSYDFSLSLPQDFTDYSDQPIAEGYNFFYSNGTVGIGGICCKNNSNCTLEEIVIREANYYRTELNQKDGFWLVTYEELDMNEPQTFINVYYQMDSEYYWLVQGYCTSAVFETYGADIWQYITSGTFNEK